MGTLVRSPDLLKGTVIVNTAIAALKEGDTIPAQLRVFKTPVVAEFLLEGLTSTFDQMSRVQADPDSISADVVELYERPVVDSGNAKGPLAILRMASDGPDHPTAKALREIETYIQELDIPAGIVWGMNDPLLAARLPEMVEHFPNAQVTETTAGHFLQEEGDSPAAIADALQRVLGQIRGE